jgi:tripartite-type tricarboxylate transporter receptor subunit TctC
MQRRALLALAATPAFAQEAPIRIIVPYAAGGGSDSVARLLAGPMGGFLGAQLVVENRPGATGLIGTQQVARAAPDGLTLVLADTPHVINPHIHPQAGYDAVADFQPIAMVGTTPLLLVAHPGAGIADFAALRARALAAPGTLGFGTGGIGSTPHVAYEALRARSGITLNHIPYRGSAPALNDVVAGHLPLTLTAAPAAVPHLRAGRVIGLAVSGLTRDAAAPDVPSLDELDVTGFEVLQWYGMLAPARTPPTRLHAAVQAALATPETAARLTAIGITPRPESQANFAAFLQAESARWGGIARAANIRVE